MIVHMKNTSRFLVLLTFVGMLVGGSSAFAGDDVRTLMRKGVDQLYNVEFDGAARSFDAVIKAAPNDPRGYFYRANVHLFSYLFSRRQDQLQSYLSMSDRAISIAERRIASNGADAEAKLFLGMTYGYKAIANARAENIMAAAVSARTCYATLNEVVQGNKKMYDAYLGLGIFHFIFGSVPEAGQFIAGIGGFKGDAALGLREIETAANRGDYFKQDAQLIHALLNIYYREQVNQGLASLSAISKRFPKNVAMLYAIGNVYLDQNQPNQAVEFFERITAQGNSDFKMITAMSYGRVGIALFSKNEFGKAKGYLQKFLRYSEEKMLKAYGWYLLGVCYEIEGDRANAVKSYDRSIRSPHFKSPEDQYAARKSRELKATPLTQTDLAIMKALNAVNAGGYDLAISLSRGVLNGTKLTAAQRAQAQYALGQGLKAKGDCMGAIDAFTRAATVGKHAESWVDPYSYYNIAECYRKMGNNDKRQEFIGKAEEYHGYDNEPQLRFKIGRDVTLID
jgi:tetratricopeptide (TPR) repeat protein